MCLSAHYFQITQKIVGPMRNITQVAFQYIFLILLVAAIQCVRLDLITADPWYFVLRSTLKSYYAL